MTPKERVMAFFRHEPVDELPTDEGIFVLFNPEAYKERPSHEHGGVDWFGVPWKYESSVDAIAPDHSVEPIMEDICDWRELVKFPDLDAWDWSKVEEIDHISEIDRENKVFEIMFVNGPFERLHMLMGFENALCALLTDPEEVEEFFNTYMEWKIKLMEKVIEYYKPDVLMFHDDWGTQNVDRLLITVSGSSAANTVLAPAVIISTIATYTAMARFIFAVIGSFFVDFVVSFFSCFFRISNFIF